MSWATEVSRQPCQATSRKAFRRLYFRMTFSTYQGDALNRIPQNWLLGEWIRNPDNHPGYDALQDEYDFPYRSIRGMIHNLITYTNKGPEPDRSPKPYHQSYYYFAATALYMLLSPEEFGLRANVRKRLNGADVVTQVRKYGAPNCRPEFWEAEQGVDDNSRLNILHIGFGPLWARMFNEQVKHYMYLGRISSAEPLELRIENRAPRAVLCPSCDCIHVPVSRDIYLPGSPEHSQKKAEMVKRAAKRSRRDANG